jgi:hypothetical protein
MSRFSAFGTTLDPLDTDRGTTIGTFSASVPTGSGLRGSGVASGTSGTQKGVFKMDKTLTTKLPPVAPKGTKKPPVLVKPAPLVKPGAAPKVAPKPLSPRGAAPRGTPTPKRFTPSRATLPGGRPAVTVDQGDAYVDQTAPAAAPSWTTAIYLNEMLAIAGKTIPSNYYPGVTYTVATTTLDGFTAPAISVTVSGGSPTQVLPTSADWTNTASLTLAAKQAADAGVAPPTTGGGTITVTSTPTGGEGSVWTDGSASYPTGEASSLSAQAQATVDAAATPTELITDDEMTVSADITTSEEGFFAKYKWWIAGGSVGAAGVYAYLHRMDPSKYPLPEMLSKLVRG